MTFSPKIQGMLDQNTREWNERVKKEDRANKVVALICVLVVALFFLVPEIMGTIAISLVVIASLYQALRLIALFFGIVFRL